MYVIYTKIPKRMMASNLSICFRNVLPVLSPKHGFRFYGTIMSAAKIPQNTPEFGGNNGNDGNNGTSITPFSRIVEKEENMTMIRSMIHNTLCAGKSQSYIVLTHTYPAWRNVLKLTNIKDAINTVQKNSYSANNPYGHTLVDFFKVSENGSVIEDNVYNVGTTGPYGINRKNFMHKFESHEYFFNNNEENKNVTGNQQGGILERSFISIVIPVDDVEYTKMTNFYDTIISTNENNTSKIPKYEFRLGSHLFTNPVRNYVPWLNERGNCCYWTSKGLVEGQMIDSHSSFPMVCFYKLLLNIKLRGMNRFKQDNTHMVVFYKGLQHENYPKGSFLYPFYWFANSYNNIWAVERFADAVVEPIKLVKSSTTDNIEYSIKASKKYRSDNDQKWIDQCINKLRSIFRFN